jgi:hypothetical protein
MSDTRQVKANRRWLWLLLIVPAFIAYRVARFRYGELKLRDSTIQSLQKTVAEVKAGKRYFTDDLKIDQAACNPAWNIEHGVHKDVADAIKSECDRALPFLRAHATRAMTSDDFAATVK